MYLSTKCLLREWDKLILDDNDILYHKTGQRTQLVLPGKFKCTVLQMLHNKMGHQGVDRTSNLVRDTFFWPQMQKDIEHYVLSICTCLKQQQKNQANKQEHELKSIVTTWAFELLLLTYII